LLYAVLAAVGGCGGGMPPTSPANSDDGGSPADANAGTDSGTPPDAAADAGADASPARGLHVEGNQLVKAGKPVRLLGVDHSGSEYACVGGYAIFEGPTDDSLAAAMQTWHVNAVRLPLNEDCWLGINGVAAAYSGANYRAAVEAYVARLHAHGFFTILDLHWNAPGANLAQQQQPLADQDHAIGFWSSVAAAFKNDPDTIFDLYNEPYVTTLNAQTQDPWACWLHGCTITQSAGGITGTWMAAGMQAMLDAVRGAGATNVVMAGGLAYSNDLSGWLAHEPQDPLRQLAASYHIYNFNTCADTTCWNAQALPVAQKVPLITGELGENDCAHGFIDGYMKWADSNGVSYLGWTWNAWDCKAGPSLITDYMGTTSGMGTGFKAHLLVENP
jgi:endoglucanase